MFEYVALKTFRNVNFLPGVGGAVVQDARWCACVMFPVQTRSMTFICILSILFFSQLFLF